MQAITFRPGDAVRHATRGPGTVETVAYSPVTHRPVKVIVRFARGADTLRVVCWPDDLRHEAPVAPMPTPPMRPTLYVVPGPGAAA